MFSADYFNEAVERLRPHYDTEEATAILYTVFEEVLLIRRAHLRLLNKDLGQAELMKLEQIMERLLTGEPLQYILGRAWFCNLPLLVNPSVLIPRQETEELVAWVIQYLKDHTQLQGILDLCTGSGCIALALKHDLPQQTLTGIDVSADALETARINARQLQLKVNFEQVDLLHETGAAFLNTQQAQVWVSNPPYIPLHEKEAMHLNVVAHEPHIALFVSDHDPLLFYRTILNAFAANASARAVFFEISAGQADALQTLNSKAFSRFELKNDLNGNPRMLLVEKPAQT